MTDSINEVSQALSEIKSAVDAKFAETALKADVDAAIEKALVGKVDAEEVTVLKAALEALEAKLDAIPSPSVITKKDTNMNISEVFKKNLEEKGVAKAEIFVKGIARSSNIVGAPTETFGLSGALFAANPFRQLARFIPTTATAIKLPYKTGNHGVVKANATTKGATPAGSAAVTEVSLILETYHGGSEISKEAASDIIDFDTFWTQDVIDELAAAEAASHVATVAAMAGVTTAGIGTLTLADFAALHASVGPQYAVNGAFVVSSGAMATLRTLNTASTGGDLVFDAQLGSFRLFGSPIYQNNYMANVANGAVVAAFGDFGRGLALAQKGGPEVSRYDQTKPGYWTYVGEMRSAMAATDANAVKTLTIRAS